MASEILHWEGANGDLLEGNRIEDLDSGPSLFPAVTFSDCQNLIVKNNFIDGLSVSHSNLTISNNRIKAFNDVPNFAVAVTGGSQAHIVNNVIMGRRDHLSSVGISVRDSRADVINNTIVDGDVGLLAQGTATVVEAMNNIIVANLSCGLQAEQGATLTSSYNDIWDNGTNYSGTVPGTGDISKDPLFVDQENGDYRLRGDSPCVNAGNPDPSFNDLDGSRNDMGAFGGPELDPASPMWRGVSMNMPSASVCSGDTITISITGQRLKGVTEIQMDVIYHTALPFMDFDTDSLTRGFSVTQSLMHPNVAAISLSGVNRITVNKGTLGRLCFIAQSTSDTTVTVRLEGIKLIDEVGNVYSLPSIEGHVKIHSAGIEQNTAQENIPSRFVLDQNYPNPFNSQTMISYQLPRRSLVKLEVYNILGQKVCTLINEIQKPGIYHVAWDGRDDRDQDLPSGVYFCRLKAGNFRQVRKMIILR